jgi:hypothetical protein
MLIANPARLVTCEALHGLSASALVFEIYVGKGLSGRVVHGEALGVLDHGPGWREPTRLLGHWLFTRT